jgi:hypothetical protein
MVSGIVPLNWLAPMYSSSKFVMFPIRGDTGPVRYIQSYLSSDVSSSNRFPAYQIQGSELWQIVDARGYGRVQHIVSQIQRLQLCQRSCCPSAERRTETRRDHLNSWERWSERYFASSDRSAASDCLLTRQCPLCRSLQAHI